MYRPSAYQQGLHKSGAPPPSPASRYSYAAVIYISVCYMLAMGVCGCVYIALCSTLTVQASNAMTAVDDIGTVFIARGGGCLLAVPLCSLLYSHWSGRTVMAVCAFTCTFALLCIPYCRSLSVLHALYFLIGLQTSILEAGSQLMLVKFHMEDARPWVGVNSITFCASGIAVPALQVVLPEVSSLFCVFSLCSVGAGICLLSCPEIGQEETSIIATSNSLREPQNFSVEGILAAMVLILMGAGETAMFLLKPYVEATGAIHPENEGLLFACVLVSSATGKVIGAIDLSLCHCNRTIVSHLCILVTVSAMASLLVVNQPHCPQCLWIGALLFGAGQGPTVSYCFDLCSRFTYTSERSVNILMIGLNLGIAVVPYCATMTWVKGVGPPAVFIVTTITTVLCVPLIVLLTRVSHSAYMNGYSSIPEID